MATAKKAAVKAPAAKAPAKKAATKTPAAKAAPTALKPIKKSLNKTELTATLAEQSGVEPKAVKAVLAALDAVVAASVAKKGAGEFTMPGMFKVTATQVPAKKARKGIDPFTKQERMFAAKPATVKVKLRALKKLKDAAL